MVNLTKVKFKEDGSFNHFSGNTVVANLFENEKLITLINFIQGEYRKLSFIKKFTLTPNKSIHMTVIELLCDLNRKEEFWSSKLQLDTPINEVSNFFGNLLTKFPLTQENIQMRVTGLGDQNILVEPANEESELRLKEIREYVSNATGVRFPNHDSYQFHISLGYLREKLTNSEREEFEKLKEKFGKLLKDDIPIITIKRVDYTTFVDMTEFIPYQK